MAIPSDLTKRQSISIDRNKVGEVSTNSISDFSLVLTRDYFDDAVVDPSGSVSARSDGGDIRFSSDLNGLNQLACDIIRFEHDSVSGAGDANIVIRVLVPVLNGQNSSSDTTIYMWFKGTSTVSQPVKSDTYGQYNAYDSGWKGYWPLEEDPSGAAPQMLDRTSNLLHGTSYGSMTTDDSVRAQPANPPTVVNVAKIGNGLDFDGSNDYIDTGYDVNNSLKTILCWMFAPWGEDNVTGSRQTGSGTDRFYVRSNGYSDLDFTFGYGDGYAANVGSFTDSEMKYFGMSQDSSSDVHCSVDGTEISSFNATFSGTGNAFTIGRLNGLSVYVDGIIDEVSIHTVYRPLEWVKTEYEQTSSTIFSSIGTVEDAFADGSIGSMTTTSTTKLYINGINY